MDVRRTITLAFALSLAPVGVTAAEKIPVQVEVTSDLAKLYPQAGSIGLALAIVPDPNIPRYRRLFDLQVQAITLGMLNDGYVLDRYAFPWASTAVGETGPFDQGAFGLLVFRCDGWRGHLCQDLSTFAPDSVVKSGQTTRVRAIYLATDTATWGVAARPLTCATRRIREQLSAAPAQDLAEPCRKQASSTARKTDTPGTARVELLQFPGRCDSKGPGRKLVVLGPNFSGAMDSLGQQVASLVDSQITGLCLVSSTTTESSNPNVESPYPHLDYVRLSVDDGIKLLRLSELAENFGYFKPMEDPAVRKSWRNRKSRVAFLAEASTFGYGVCNPWTQMDPARLRRIKKFCRDAQTLYFPAAVADIRNSIDQQRASQKNEVQAAVQAALASEHLTLDVGAENGSEFPENRQSRLTAASQQLALDHVLEQLEQYRPKMVIVVATDVRDRLFLFDQLRQRLPSAMLIDLESDILLAHPDFLHASRGAITVASANLFVRRGRLFGCEQTGSIGGEKIRTPLASWALDGQGILANAVSRLFDSGQTPTAQPCILDEDESKFGGRAPIMHVVTLKGLRQVSRVVDLKPAPGSQAERIKMARDARPRNVAIGQWLSVLCCFAVVLPWLWIRPLRKAGRPVLTLPPWEITLAAGVAGAVIWTFAMLAAYSGEDPESGYALVYWSLAILSMGLGGLYQCLKRVQEAGQNIVDLPRRHRWALSAAGLFACVLAAAPPLGRYLFPDPNSAVVDDELITRLGLDIGQGIAYHVVVALGVITILAVMIALATGLCILVRNNRLLDINTESPAGKRGARSAHFPAGAILGVMFFIALIAVPSLISPLGGPRLTVFGPCASLIATVVLIVTTLGATIFTVFAIHSSRRIRIISAHIGRCVAPPLSPGRTEPVGEYPGLWPASEWQPDLFAATPVVARVSADVVAGLNGSEPSWKTLINEFLGSTDEKRIDDGDHRRAVFALLASEVSLYRWFVIGAVLCAIASVCAAYLFPLEADALLMWNLMVLVVHAFLAGYVATAFERDGVLSNILCNRPRKASFSATLFTYAALPFFALGFAIAVSQVPGVVDWGGGLLALLSALGLGP
jgi:hypothetical protein